MSLILNPTRSRTETAYGIKYETTTFSTGVTCTIPTDEPSRAADLASVIVEGCAKSPMEYEDFRDLGYTCLQLHRPNNTGYSRKRCNVYKSDEGILVKDPVDDGSALMQFFFMNALSRALEDTSSNVHAVNNLACISTPNGRSYTIMQEARGIRMRTVRHEWDKYSYLQTDQKRNDVVTEVIAERITTALHDLTPRFFASRLANDQPGDKKRSSSGIGNTFIDIDLDKLSLEALYSAPIWLIDQAHPTIRSKATHKIARHFPIRSTYKP